MKRRISLLLAVVMILGSFSFAFAAEESREVKDGAFLKKVGVLEGINGDLKLEDNLRRQDMVVMIARLHGAEKEAEAYSPEGLTFTDFTDRYYKPIIKWAVDEKLVEGHTAERFGFGEDTTAQQYVTVLLRALGYNEEAEDYAKVMELAEKLGLLKDVKVEAEDAITRGQMSVMTFNALGTNMKDSDKTLADKLDIEMPAPDKPTELTAKAYSENLKEVVVEFSNAELIKEENLTDVRNYRIANNSVESLTVDGDSVILELKTPLVKDKSYSVLLRNLGEKVNGKKFSFKAVDNTIPSVTDAKMLGKKGILVTTSEPVKYPLGRIFKIDGKNISMNVEQYGRDLVLTPYYDKEVFPEDAKELTIEGLEDHAGYKSVKENFPLEMVEDTEAPVVEKVVLKGPKVVQVVFNKDVYKGSLGGYNNRRDTGNVSYEMGRHVEYTIDKNVDKIARNVVQYEFNIELSKRADVTVEGVTNHSGIEMDKVTVRVDEEIDYTEPEIVSAPLWYHEESKTKTYVNDDGKTVPARKAHLLIEFDKDIKGNFDKPEDYFALYEREVIKRANIDDEVDITVSYARNYDRLLVSIDGLKINNKDKDFDYVLEVRDFKDNSGNRMYRDYVEFELKTGYDFQVNQSKGVKGVEIDPLYSDGTGREITVYFTEAVDLNLATDKTNYIFRDSDGYAEDLVDLGGEAIVERDGKTVTLRIPAPFKETNYDTLELAIALKDKEGVRISGPRVYTFATKSWKEVNVTPVEKDSSITYINASKPVTKDELVLDKGIDMNTISVKITGKANDKAQVVVYNKNGDVEPTLVKTITIPANATEHTEALASKALVAGDKFTVVTKMGEEEAKLVVKAVETTKKVDVVYNADDTIQLTDLAADSSLVFPYGTKVYDLPASAFTVTPKENATATFTKELNKLFITVAAENGEKDIYTVTLSAAVIDTASTVAPATKTDAVAGTAETITVTLKDSIGKAVTGMADKFVIAHTGATDPTTVTVGKVTETTPGTYTFTVNNTAQEAVTYTITVDGVALTGRTSVVTTN